ncbi:MAG: hypothetical protein Ct9H300mP11_21130 [Chloroflexota bacterium]|nr:MAG: hypothetical protein Ct9H300mP11_21130 [Chloroflexota bacterium]
MIQGWGLDLVKPPGWVLNKRLVFAAQVFQTLAKTKSVYADLSRRAGPLFVNCWVKSESKTWNLESYIIRWAIEYSKGTKMPSFTKGDVTIHYEESGTGFPFLITRGGLNSVAKGWPGQVFNAFEEYSKDFPGHYYGSTQR